MEIISHDNFLNWNTVRVEWKWEFLLCTEDGYTLITFNHLNLSYFHKNKYTLCLDSHQTYERKKTISLCGHTPIIHIRVSPHCLMLVILNFGSTLGSLWNHPRVHFGSTLGSPWKYPWGQIGKTLGSLWKYPRGHFGSVLGSLWKNPRGDAALAYHSLC